MTTLGVIFSPDHPPEKLREAVTVGIGLLPVPLRNVALSAMEIATVERLFPGRFVPGIGHGVLDWMGRVGARAGSPMTLLREYTAALRSLLQGETVTSDGRYVQLRDVALDCPPAELLGAAAEPLAAGRATSGRTAPHVVVSATVHDRAGGRGGRARPRARGRRGHHRRLGRSSG